MRLLISLLLLATLAACSPPKPAVASIEHLTATGGSDGSGSWIISWSAEGDSVELNGIGVGLSGQQEHIAPVGEVMSFELTVSSGAVMLTETVTIAGLSSLVITDMEGNPGPFDLEPGQALQLQAAVAAEGAGQLPNQAVTWHSTAPEIVSVSDTGLVTVHGFGSADIYATSQQWTGSYDFVQVVSSAVPVIESFTAEPVLDSPDVQWRVSWSTSAESVELNDSPAAASGSLELAVADVQTVTLKARNGPVASVTESFDLAPVTGLELIQQNLPLMLGITEQLRLTVDVVAPGSDHVPADAVTWHSSDTDVVTIDSSGVVTAVGGGSAILTVRSRQYQQVAAEFTVTVPTPGVYELSVNGDPTVLEAGETLSLNWRAVSLTSLTLETWSAEELINSQELIPAELEATAAAVPVNLPSVNYRLSWTAAGGGSGRSSFWDADVSVLGWVCDQDDVTVTFADPQVEDSVRGLFSLDAAADITCADVQQQFPPQLNDGQETNNLINLNRCDPHAPKVSSLEGLQHLVHLARLELTCNGLTDISRLASLTGLVEINLDDNLIEDISPLAGLTRLQVLGLYNNRVRNIDALSGLHDLQILYLSENFVTDIAALTDLHDLRHVWLYYNCAGPGATDCLADLSALSGKNQLESVVFHVNEVSDLSFIGPGMTELQLIIASGNRITDLSPLTDLPKLATLAIDENLISTLEPLVDNDSFGTHPAYKWQRGYIQMPPAGHALNGVNLAMGYNCLDPEVEPVKTQLQELRAREAVITGEDAEVRNCNSGFSTLSVPASRQQLLESWRQSR